MPEEPPTSERAAVYYIAAIIFIIVTKQIAALTGAITFQHAFDLIHIMALDKTFQRFALSVQTKSDF